jgi:transposase
MSYPQTYPDWHRELLRDQYATTDTREIAKLLDRPLSTIYSQAKKMGLRKLEIAKPVRSRPEQFLTDAEEESIFAQIKAAHNTSDIVQKALAARPAVQVAMMGWK